MNSKSLSLRFSERFLSFVNSYSEGRPTTSFIRNLTESMVDTEIIHRRKLSDALNETTSSQLRILADIKKSETADVSDLAFVLIHCYRAYICFNTTSLKKKEYLVSLISIVREVSKHLKASSSCDVNQVYRDMGFTASKGIDEQFDALIYSPGNQIPHNMRFVCAVTDQMHHLTGMNIVSNELLNRLKSLIPVAVLGLLSEASINDRVTAIQSRLFAPEPSLLFAMHSHFEKSEVSVSLQGNRIFQLKIGNTGLLVINLKSEIVGFEMSFSPVASLEFIDLALHRDLFVQKQTQFIGREISVIYKEVVEITVNNVTIFLPEKEANQIFDLIADQTNYEFFNAYIDYSRCTLGDI
ncbi:hypothetical protein RGL50_004089 [Vibrio alginolyticus]|jgi:hypothetical protein|nr:hypothetical protein [Vibrio alginolyticus]